MAEKSRYYLDATGSRCRDRDTGLYANCEKCPRCVAIKKGKK